jgi:DNA-binding transcriptional LysR family regulator
MDAWLFQDHGKRFEVIVNGTLSTTSGEVVHDWVRAGKGIALKAAWDLQSELTAGTIVQCLSELRRDRPIRCLCEPAAFVATHPSLS